MAFRNSSHITPPAIVIFGGYSETEIMSQRILHHVTITTSHQIRGTRRARDNYGTHGQANFSPISSAHFNVPLNTVRCQHTSIAVGLLQVSTTAPSSPSKQAGDSDVKLSCRIKVIQSEPAPLPPSASPPCCQSSAPWPSGLQIQLPRPVYFYHNNEN